MIISDKIKNSFKQAPDSMTAAKSCLFHGTCEEFDEKDLKGGGYDNILWTSETPDIAQSYIPESGCISYYSVRKWDLNDSLSPFFNGQPSLDLHIARYMGFDAELCGKTGWKWNSAKSPTYADVVNYLISMGYEYKEDEAYKLKTSYKNGVPQLFRADYKIPGRLFVLYGKEFLNIFDDSDTEFDLMDPTYHRLDMFKMLADKGYDAIRMHDAHTKEIWGTFTHESIGLFPQAIAKLEKEVIPAVSFDWKDNLQSVVTEEFQQFYQSALAL